MDKFIESFAQRPTSQKILITIGFTAGFLLVLAVLYFVTTPKIENPKSSNSYQASILPTSVALPTDQPRAVWPVYKGPTYQISYPSGLSATPGVIAGGGNALVLEGKEGSLSYNIEIQVIPQATDSAENIYGIFRGFGYKESDTTIANLPAKKFKGNIGNLQETAVVFENNGQVYKIQLGYTSTLIDNKIEQIFNSILSTFKFI